MPHSALIPTFLLVFIQPKPHLRGWSQSTIPPFPPHLPLHPSAHFYPHLSFLYRHHPRNNIHPSPCLCPPILWCEILNLSCVPLFSHQFSSVCSSHPSIYLLVCLLSSALLSWQCCRRWPIIPVKVVPTSIYLTQSHGEFLDVIWHNIMPGVTRQYNNTL